MLYLYNERTRTLELTATLPLSRASGEAGQWVHAVDPSADERAALVAYGADSTDLDHSLDPDEPGRYSTHGGSTVVILRVPLEASEPLDRTEPRFLTESAGVLLLDGMRVLTVCRRPCIVFERAASVGPALLRPWPLIFTFVERAAERFLEHLREIDAAVERLEDELNASLRNREVLELLRYQKSLVHFTNALTSIERLLARIERHQRATLTDDEMALLEDARVEVAQARELCSVAENILSQMMDAFASIISNNLNVVMKVLTAATVVLSVPTLIASIYGMNVLLPGQHRAWAFAVIVGTSVTLAVALTALLRRLRWI